MKIALFFPIAPCAFGRMEVDSGGLSALQIRRQDAHGLHSAYRVPRSRRKPWDPSGSSHTFGGRAKQHEVGVSSMVPEDTLGRSVSNDAVSNVWAGQMSFAEPKVLMMPSTSLVGSSTHVLVGSSMSPDLSQRSSISGPPPVESPVTPVLSQENSNGVSTSSSELGAQLRKRSVS